MSERATKSDVPVRGSIVDRLKWLFGAETQSVRDDIKGALAESGKEDLSVHELAMLRSVLGLHELRVRDIMVPRADIVSVELRDRLADLLRIFRTAGHSRLPVHGQTLDDPRGMVHIRDFVDYLASQAEIHAEKHGGPQEVSDASTPSMDLGAVDLGISLAKANLTRPVLFVPPSMLALDLLVKMQAERTHMALVIDEYGGTDGLVSIEDVVEIVVGDIEDEHDEDEEPVISLANDGSVTADARAMLADVVDKLAIDLVSISGAEDIDTIGGLVTATAGRVPVRGEVVRSDSGLEFEILDADPRRVKKLRISKIDPIGPVTD